ncbi:ATP-binding protein [Herbaspirillum autotrophicum]|uniref:ATP-binding protein n=1 Tax=Herbaspirillum autotrophicum TaxID=180195 RepID=UPI00067BDFCC|nr:ATP-binding protein [Herbaspirillum autotrophicum]
MFIPSFSSRLRVLPQHQLLARLFWMRCLALTVQLLLIVAAVFWIGLDLPLPALLSVVGVQCLINAFTWWRMRNVRPAPDFELWLQLLADVTALTALLYFAGGATNPFVSFYLPALAVAAAILPGRYAFALALYSLAGYSALTYFYQPLHIHDHDQAMAYHLAGMWLNFVVSAALITWFVTRMSATVREHSAQLALAREQQLQGERIVALGTQAASAAHEMSTPLSTVAVIAGELRVEASRNAALAMHREDLAIVEEQIAACKTALDRMSMHIQPAASTARIALAAWLKSLVDGWRLRHPATVVKTILSADTAWIAEQQIVSQILLTLLDNAAQTGGRVEVRLSVTAQQAVIEVNDNGAGIDAGLLKRLGYEPVRSHTGGKGIGLMLAFASARQIGARIVLSSTPPNGTRVQLTLPLTPGARP